MILDRNTWIILKREYLTRVKNKSFLLVTFGAPLAFVVFFVAMAFIMNYKSGDVLNVGVVDESGQLSSYLEDSKYVTFVKGGWSEKDVTSVKDEKLDGFIVLPAILSAEFERVSIKYISDGKLDLDKTSNIESLVKDAARQYKIDNLELDMSKVDLLSTKVNIQPEKLTKIEGDDKGPTSLTSLVASGIGIVMGILMYFIVFMNGSRVMQSVMEEKTNRIVEVMISSVKPFQLMMGKVLGVGMVGMTQFLLWVVLIPVVMLIAQLFINVDPEQMAAQSMPAGQDMQAVQEIADGFNMAAIISELMGMNWFLIIPSFIIFFILGYVMYATLFAAVGSAIGDDISEGQSLTIPITIPVVIAFYIMISTINSPNSSLAVWSSIFPLFSPIVMPARLAYDPPLWQLGLSVVLLILFVLLMVWLSAKIYRVGILMYGKKASFKELVKWMKYR